MAYATVEDVASGFRELDADDQSRAAALLDEAKIIIDAYTTTASDDAKKVVSCRMVRRAIGDDTGLGFPMGATQGTMTAGTYSQSWTLSNGSAGELYLTKLEKKMLGIGEKIGMTNPFEDMTNA